MTKAKNLGEYKENLGNKLKDLPGSESLKKEYKGKLFREIVVDPDYQKLKEEYLSEKKSKIEKEALFQEAFLKAKKINPALMEDDFRAVIGIKSDNESVEKMETPQLEDENYKIDADKSKAEKLKEGWEEEEKTANILGEKVTITVLKKELTSGAYVWEYQAGNGMPEHLVGEQLFNWNAVLKLGLEDKLPSLENMEAIKNSHNNHEEFIENNFTKGDKSMFAGYWDPGSKGFSKIGRWADCWLSDGDDVELSKVSMDPNIFNPEFGFSVRLCKN